MRMKSEGTHNMKYLLKVELHGTLKSTSLWLELF